MLIAMDAERPVCIPTRSVGTRGIGGDGLGMEGVWMCIDWSIGDIQALGIIWERRGC